MEIPSIDSVVIFIYRKHERFNDVGLTFIIFDVKKSIFFPINILKILCIFVWYL